MKVHQNRVQMCPHFPDEEKSQVMLCGGHVARAHTNWLGELAKQKSFSPTLQDSYKKEFLEVSTVIVLKDIQRIVGAFQNLLYMVLAQISSIVLWSRMLCWPFTIFTVGMKASVIFMTLENAVVELKSLVKASSIMLRIHFFMPLPTKLNATAASQADQIIHTELG